MPSPKLVSAPVNVPKPQPLVQSRSAGQGLALPAVPVLQQKANDDEETMQRKAAPLQLKNSPVYTGAAQGLPAVTPFPIQKKANKTGLPDNLKAGVEQLSGFAMDDVKVHYNSAKPATLQAHAYAQGTDIHIAPGQEKHLPHEAWHVAQQKQGRVKPTLQMKGVAVNDDSGLEREADKMGRKTLQINHINFNPTNTVQREAAGFDAKHEKLTGYSDQAKKLGVHKTNVSLTPGTLTSTGESVGVKMVANPIGPDHPQGSSPELSAAKNQIATFNQHDTYIRGHLLNGNIGGPGIAQNLFPITSMANSQHYNAIEQYVVYWVNDLKYYVHYEVEVKNRKDSKGEAEFHCKAYAIDAAGDKADKSFSVAAVIKSIPTKSTGSLLPETSPASGKAIDKDSRFTDIEYQKGKFPVGYDEIDENILAIMEKDFATPNAYLGTTVDAKLLEMGFSEEAKEKIVEAVMSPEDEAIWKNLNKRTWNTWMKKLNADYK